MESKENNTAQRDGCQMASSGGDGTDELEEIVETASKGDI
jgi:hypothetical protein